MEGLLKNRCFEKAALQCSCSMFVIKKVENALIQESLFSAVIGLHLATLLKEEFFPGIFQRF